MLTGGIARFVMLGLFGAILTASFSVSVVLAQAYLPRNAGMASGLIVGFAIGTGGLAVTLLGIRGRPPWSCRRRCGSAR